MTHYAEQHSFPYSAEFVYAIVEDVERYPEFLPWVLEATIINRTTQGFIADLTIGYSFYKDTYRSEVILTPPERIVIRYIQGPFKYLHNRWVFTPTASRRVDVNFFIDFEFKSSFFQGLLQTVFAHAVSKMVRAFEDRARLLSYHLQSTHQISHDVTEKTE
jgi:coenzyme Q-binding protein COQ10